MIYVSVDLETTGLDPVKDQVLEIGAIAYDTVQKKELSEFHAVLYYDRLEGSAYALWLNQRLLKQIADYKAVQPASIAWHEFVTWLKQWNTEDGVVVGAGKNFGTFDKAFIEQATWKVYGKLFDHRVLDPMALWIDPDKDVAAIGTSECCKRAGISTDVTHHALDDARQVIQLLELGWRRNG